MKLDLNAPLYLLSMSSGQIATTSLNALLARHDSSGAGIPGLNHAVDLPSFVAFDSREHAEAVKQLWDEAKGLVDELAQKDPTGLDNLIRHMREKNPELAA
jgi:hypothetical protein